MILFLSIVILVLVERLHAKHYKIQELNRCLILKDINIEVVRKLYHNALMENYNA